MNLYIMVEGEATEMQLYPVWLSYLIPELRKVNMYKAVTNNSYYLFCGQGIPSIYKHTANAIRDINQFGNYDYLIVCLDCDELTPEMRKQKLLDYLQNEGVALQSKCKLEIVTQNACVESWFLGNRKVFKRNPQSEKLAKYIEFYNVYIEDPEIMQKFEGFSQKAHFHEAYLREILKEHGQTYRKSSPKVVLNEPYYKELQKRIAEEPAQMTTLRHFFDLCKHIRKNIISH